MRLKRYAYVPIAAFALWAVLLAVSPATATAKETSQANDPQITNHDAGAAKRIVVAPGDSLWSISAQWLGPEATTQQIANGVERIYTRNQTQIGSDPDLIFTGQKLLLPSQVEQRRPEPRRAAPAQHTGQPTESSPLLRAANNGSDTPAEAAVGKVDHKARQLPHGQSETLSFPEPARAAPVGAVRLLTPNGPSPLAQPVTSGARSIFSIVSASVATVSEALLRGSYSGRKLLGGALIAMSTVLALILALHVVRVVRGPRRYTRRRAPKEENLTLAAEGPWLAEPSGHAANGGASSDDARKIARRKHRQIRRMRPLTARRPPRGHTKATSGGLRPRQAGRRPVTWAQRARNLRRRGGRIVGTDPTKPKPMQEWKISEPLRRAIESIPVPPGAHARSTLLEVKHLAAEALLTMAPLERRRGLSDMEQRQARALQKLVATIEEACDDDKMR